MIAGKHDLTIQQGSSFELEVAVTLDDGTDPMTYDYRGQIRAYHGASTILATFTVTKGSTVAVIALDATTTEAMEATDLEPYVWDLEMHDTGTGWVQRILEGNVEVTPEVTR